MNCTGVGFQMIDLMVICRSFGHHQAHQYGTSKGMSMDLSENAESRKGFSLTRLSVTKVIMDENIDVYGYNSRDCDGYI